MTHDESPGDVIALGVQDQLLEARKVEAERKIDLAMNTSRKELMLR
jgi:hypothetical protein